MSPLSLKSRQSLDQVHTLRTWQHLTQSSPFRLNPTKRRTGTAFRILSPSLISPKHHPIRDSLRIRCTHNLSLNRKPLFQQPLDALPSDHPSTHDVLLASQSGAPTPSSHPLHPPLHLPPGNLRRRPGTLTLDLSLPFLPTTQAQPPHNLPNCKSSSAL